METAAGDMERLPEELLAAVISLTSPPDACRAAAVSRTFRAAVDTDTVWSHFLSRDLPQFNDGELGAAPLPKKALFRCLCNKPALRTCRNLTMQLDRVTGDMCYVHRKVPDIPADEKEMADETYDDDDTPEPYEWINLACGRNQRNQRFDSFQSAFWTS